MKTKALTKLDQFLVEVSPRGFIAPLIQTDRNSGFRRSSNFVNILPFWATLACGAKGLRDRDTKWRND